MSVDIDCPPAEDTNAEDTDTADPLVHRSSPVRAALVAGLALTVLLGSLCGWLGYRAHKSRQDEAFRALVVQVAEQGAINLTTIDFQHADDDVRRILDSATGKFHNDFRDKSGPFIEVVTKVQSRSVGTVTEAGLESADAHEGCVLLAVTVTTTKKGVPDGEPRHWRMRMTVSRDGTGEAKVSEVEFVP